MKPSTDREAISLIIDGLIAAGCKPCLVRDGEAYDYPYDEYASKGEALDDLTSCDESVLFVDLPTADPDTGVDSTFIHFVLGNDPEEVVSDHGVSLSPYLDPIVEPWWE